MTSTNPATTTPAELVSDSAIELATDRSLDTTSTTAVLLDHADHDRELMEQAHSAHLHRMATRSSDDFEHLRALRIIEDALRRLPRARPTPFDRPSGRSLFDRLRGRRTVD